MAATWWSWASRTVTLVPHGVKELQTAATLGSSRFPEGPVWHALSSIASLHGVLVARMRQNVQRIAGFLASLSRAGRVPASRRTFPAAVALIRMPNFLNSPKIRRWPWQAPFLPAGRRIVWNRDNKVS